MILSNLFEDVSLGYDNLRKLLQAHRDKQDAVLSLGEEPVTLNRQEVLWLVGKYQAYRKDGKVDDFIKVLEDPVRFDRHMKQLRTLHDKQKNVTGSVPGQRDVTVNSLTETPLNPNDPINDYMAKRSELQRIQLDPKTGKDPKLVAAMQAEMGALEREAEAAGLDTSVWPPVLRNPRPGVPLRRSRTTAANGLGRWTTPAERGLEEGVAEGSAHQLNELFDAQQEYFKLADGQVIRVDYRQAGLNPDGMPGSIEIVPVNPKIMPTSGLQTIQPWDKANNNIRNAIQKWVQSGQQGVAEGFSTDIKQPGTWAGHKIILQDAIRVLARLRDISKDVRDGKTYQGNLAKEYYNDVWNVYTWLEKKDIVHWGNAPLEYFHAWPFQFRHASAALRHFRDIIKNAIKLRKKAKRLAQEPGFRQPDDRQAGSGADTVFAAKIVQVLEPWINWLKWLETDWIKWLETNMITNQENKKGVAEGIRDDAMAGLQKTIDFAKKHGYKINRSPKGQVMTFVNTQLGHNFSARVDNDGDSINVNWTDGNTSGNDDASYFDQVFQDAYKRALEDNEYRKSLATYDDNDDDNVPHDRKYWAAQKKLEQGVAEGIRDDAMAGLQKTIDFAKKHGYKINRSPKGQVMTFVNTQLGHNFSARVDNDGDSINVNWTDGNTSGNDDASYFDQVFQDAYKRALKDSEYRKSLATHNDNDDDNVPHDREYWAAQKKLEKGVAEGMKPEQISKYAEELVSKKGHEKALEYALMMANLGRDSGWLPVIRYIKSMKQGVTEGTGQFHVYHKVKGDRMGGPDYKLLKSFPDKNSAVVFAKSYNEKHGYKRGGFHGAVIRTTHPEQGVAEGFSPLGYGNEQEVADQIADSIGHEKGLTSDDIYDAIDEFESMGADGDELFYEFDRKKVAQILFNKLGIKDESIIKKAHNKVTEREFYNRDDFDRDAVPGDTVRTSRGGTLTKTSTGVRHESPPPEYVDDSDPVPGAPRKRGRPPGTGTPIGAKGPGVKSKLLQKPAIAKEHDEHVCEMCGQPIVEKAVSRRQQRFMGMVHAAQKGEEPASAEVAQVANTMKKSDVEDFAKTKHKGLPEKKKKKKGVKETTVAGSVAQAPSNGNGKSKKGMIFGKGVYESQMAESYDKKLKSVLTEGLSLDMHIDHLGNKTLNVEATDEDVEKLARILKLAGLGSSGGYETVPTSSGDSMEEDHSNKPEPQMQTADYMTNTISGGLNKSKVTGMTTIPVVPTHQVSESEMKNDLMKFYKNRNADAARRLVKQHKVTGMTTIPTQQNGGGGGPTQQVSESEMENHLMKLYKQYKTS